MSHDIAHKKQFDFGFLTPQFIGYQQKKEKNDVSCSHRAKVNKKTIHKL
jgi:hypothetical protein